MFGGSRDYLCLSTLLKWSFGVGLPPTHVHNKYTWYILILALRMPSCVCGCISLANIEPVIFQLFPCFMEVEIVHIIYSLTFSLSHTHSEGV